MVTTGLWMLAQKHRTGKDLLNSAFTQKVNQPKCSSLATLPFQIETTTLRKLKELVSCLSQPAENTQDTGQKAEVRNMTEITEILLLGIPTLQKHKFLSFSLFLMIYWVTMCGNLLIISLVVHSKNLHSPMYFFLTQLSVCDILMATDIGPHSEALVPNMLYVVLNDGGLISLLGCITQYLIFCSSACAECLLLTAMSYDRYLAICNPLRYTAKMNHKFCFKLVVMCWVISYSVLLNQAIPISKLSFCGPHVIDHFFCDHVPLLELSCSDTYVVKIESNLLSIPFVISPFFIIIFSYIYIVSTILKIPSLTGRHKAFSTCSSHLAAVCIFYGTLISIYAVPKEANSQSISKLLSLLYTLVTPLINPIIYSFRNKDMHQAFERYVRNCSMS
ncbi:olfactory receptor 1496-like [Pseudophryne corroboree]|uniref:olfactory receptor 1496-like n=1 Tax=Pseudophryne corroboree TaxID=495146 RepID=UPI003081FE16